MKIPAILITCVFLAIASAADILQNPDFELPPSGWMANATTPFALDENSTLPGWTFQGAGEYATSGPNLRLPQNGHAILLGQDGQINQTFTANGERMQYLLTFALARSVQNCTSNVSLVISAPDSSAQFSLTQRYGNEPWEVYGHRIGSWGDGESVNLVIQSQVIDTDSNSTCWPVVDALSLVTVGSLNQDHGNLLQNGGFELGPAFLNFSNEGVLLDSEPSLTESALQQWAITGTVKYLNSQNYFVPEGKSAIEIVSGASAGVQTVQALTQGSSYDLQFMLGDANDNCTGNFIVGVTAGSSVQNYTIQSRGTGSFMRYSMRFNGAGPSPTPISFQSYTTTQREDGVFCGPLIDGVVLRASSGHRSNLHIASVIALLVVAFLI